jgi:8-oxo-dGTP diphosphatase
MNALNLTPLRILQSPTLARLRSSLLELGDRQRHPYGSPVECNRSDLLGMLDGADYCIEKLQNSLFSAQHEQAQALITCAGHIQQSLNNIRDDGHLASLLLDGFWRLHDQVMSTDILPPVDNGVGLYLFEDGRLLLGLRTGSHGADQWGAAGGHCDDEDAVTAGLREGTEETGSAITLYDVQLPTLVMFVPEKNKLYRDHFLVGRLDEKPRIMEPDKCLEWRYFEPDNLPDNLFFPMKANLERGLDLRALATLR